MYHKAAFSEVIKKINISENWIKCYISILNYTIFTKDVLWEIKTIPYQLRKYFPMQ